MSVNRKIIADSLEITANTSLCNGFSSGSLVFTPTSTEFIYGKTTFFYRTYTNAGTGINLIYNSSLKRYELKPESGAKYNFPTWDNTSDWTENSDSSTLKTTSDKLYFTMGHLLVRRAGNLLKFYTKK